MIEDFDSNLYKLWLEEKTGRTEAAYSKQVYDNIMNAFMKGRYISCG